MNRPIALDTGPLGQLCHPNDRTPANKEITQWVISHLRAGTLIYVPEICDYELRRELLLLQATTRVHRLDQVKAGLRYLPISTEVMMRAAELWADARRMGGGTADPKELDSDVILAALAEQVGAVVVTANVGHLARYVEAKSWKELPPP